MEINMIVAASRNLVIGKNNSLPWKLPNESKYYKDMVRGHICVYGRKTYEGSRHKDERVNLVVTSESIPQIWDDLARLQKLHPLKKIFILGGERVYAYFMPFCTRLYFSLIDIVVEGDTHFPPFTGTLVEQGEVQVDNGVNYQCRVYENVKPAICFDGLTLSKIENSIF